MHIYMIFFQEIPVARCMIDVTRRVGSCQYLSGSELKQTETKKKKILPTTQFNGIKRRNIFLLLSFSD